MAAPASGRSLARFSKIYRCFNGEYANSSPLLQRFCTTSTQNNKPAPEVKVESAEGPSVSDLEKKFVEEKEKLVAENKKLKEDLSVVDDKYKRALAEIENTRMRMKKQIDDMKLFGIQGFSKDLLVVADILDQAIQSVPKEELSKNEHLNSMFNGLKMTNEQLLKVFGRHGLVKIVPSVGEKFDPYIHEALFEVPKGADNEGGTVALCQKTGFKLHERTLRPATVGVFKS
ncbi:grpE protein homolog 1, mitochondrial-like [Dreissena polymorpha]|uniref:grpE protein homolog 1, mitochondrial-like n=1 Tax=Dreissena polymorpha TaxID=45954 RepID=UPI002264C0A8|nr:grpE protein homolog 1, mitochondrial-like [Dreissena polymorpha]XP_052252118.1 grpE protein homolog 1, mitochondrial-like [Dreissena polymorpha]